MHIAKLYYTCYMKNEKTFYLDIQSLNTFQKPGLIFEYI